MTTWHNSGPCLGCLVSLLSDLDDPNDVAILVGGGVEKFFGSVFGLFFCSSEFAMNRTRVRSLDLAVGGSGELAHMNDVLMDRFEGF